MSKRLILALLSLAALVPHLAVWNADFTFDDVEFVETNASIRSLAAALDGLDEPFPPNRPELARYRPVTNFSYAVQHAMWGANPNGFHRFNLALYVAIVWAVFGVARRILSSDARALALALVFALHPVHTEAVDSIAGHSELLSLLLGLLALLAFQHANQSSAAGTSRPYPDPTSGWAGSTIRVAIRRHSPLLAAIFAHVCVALAVLAKESAAVLPFVFCAYALLFSGRRPLGGAGGPSARDVSDASEPDSARPGSVWQRLAPATQTLSYFALLPVYFAMRVTALGRFGPDTTILGDASVSSQILTMGRVFAEYLRLLVFPHPLHVDYYYQHSVGVQNTASVSAVAGAAVLLVSVLATGVWAWRCLVRGDGGQQERAALFGATVFFGFLLPVSHLIPFQALMAERFLFAPSLGFLLFVVALAPPLRLASPWREIVATFGCGVLAFATAVRADDWRNDVSLWGPVAAVVRDDARVHANLAHGYMRQGRAEEAAEALRKSLQVEPDHIAALNNLATLELGAGRFDSARRIYRHVLNLDPSSYVAWTNLGVVESRLLNLSRAAELYRGALVVNPNHASAIEKLTAVEEMIRNARDFLATAPKTSIESTPLPSLRRQVLAHLVIGEQATAEGLYESLIQRGGVGPRWRIRELEYQMRSEFADLR